jgi:hypothetical protein
VRRDKTERNADGLGVRRTARLVGLRIGQGQANDATSSAGNFLFELQSFISSI